MLPKDEYLPIGSVVLLKGGIKKAMIIGIMHTSKVGEEYIEHDYIAVLYPEGFITTKTMFMFNHNQITDVIFHGYNNQERLDLMDRIEKNVNKVADELKTKVEAHIEKQEDKQVTDTTKANLDDIF